MHQVPSLLPFARMKSLCQNVADAVLEVGPQHFHPRHKSKRLSCQSLNFMIIQEKGNEDMKLVMKI